LSDGRGGTLGGEREDTVTYVIGAAGRYQLPEITYQWRDATSGEVHQTKVPAVALEATAGAYQAPFSISDDLRAMGHQARLRLGGHWLWWWPWCLAQALWAGACAPGGRRCGSACGVGGPTPAGLARLAELCLAPGPCTMRGAAAGWMRCTCGCAAAVASPDCCVVGRKFPTR
jgi:hypothetical protein